MAKKKLFIGRDKEINDIYQNLEIYRYGKVRNMVYFGLSKMGKTTLLRQVARNLQNDPEIVPIFLDFSTIATVPEDFGVRFISETISAINKHNSRASTEDQDSLRQYPESIDGLKNDQETSAYFLDYDEKTRVERLATLLAVPQKILQKHSKKPFYLVDNVSEGLRLSSFKGMKNIGNIFARELFGNGTSSVMTSNYDAHMTHILDGQVFPVSHVEFYEIRPIGIVEVKKVLSERLDGLDADDVQRVAELTTGHPYYLKLLMRLFKGKTKVSSDDIDRYFEKALQGEASIALFLQGFYREVLSYSRYHGPLKFLMRFLASREGLTQTDVSKMTGITQGALRNYLNELERLRILFRDGGKYYFIDEVFQKWILLNK